MENFLTKVQLRLKCIFELKQVTGIENMIYYETYASEYEDRAEKISVRSYYPRNGSLDKAHGNYDLFFNKSGQLLNSIHTETNQKFTILYKYNSNGKILNTKQFNTATNELEQGCDYIYDRIGRIQIEKCVSFYPRINIISKSQIIHIYKNLEEITIRTSDDDDEYTTYYKHDINNLLIEEKSYYRKEGLHEWTRYEYDEKNSLVRYISLDQKGELSCSYELLTRQNGLNYGVKCISMDTNYLREYEYVFNDRGHWINQVILLDSIPHNIIERTIEYYS